MKSFERRTGTMMLALAACATAALAVGRAQQQASAVATREEAYRANNIGVSRLEQYDFDAAAVSFRRALSLDPTLAMARLNLGIALFYGGNPDEAQPELLAAKKGMPNRPQPDYVLGLIARGAGQAPEAIDAFTRVQKMDPDDVGVAINLGQLYRQERKFPEAVAEFRKALAGQPFNATAMYGLANTLVLAGSADEGRAAMEQFQKLTDSGYAVTYSQTYLEQGRYAEAIVSTGAEAPLIDTGTPAVAFVDATASLPARSAGTGGEAGSVALFDLDGDGDLDRGKPRVGAPRLSRNDTGRFADVTNGLLGQVTLGAATAVVAGDYDNDGHADLAVLRPTGLALLRRDPASGFTDATAAAQLGFTARQPPIGGVGGRRSRWRSRPVYCWRWGWWWRQRTGGAAPAEQSHRWCGTLRRRHRRVRARPLFTCPGHRPHGFRQSPANNHDNRRRQSICRAGDEGGDQRDQPAGQHRDLRDEPDHGDVAQIAWRGTEDAQALHVSHRVQWLRGDLEQPEQRRLQGFIHCGVPGQHAPRAIPRRPHAAMPPSALHRQPRRAPAISGAPTDRSR